MSSKVKQANFRLPLEYMSMIDDFASRENITKAAVITRALDCMQASYDSGNGGMPVTGSGSGASEQEINDLKNQLKQAEERARVLTSEQEIVKRSQQHAAEILSAAQKSAKELTRKATLYCETILKNSEEVLGRSMADIKNTRMNLRSAARPKNNMPK